MDTFVLLHGMQTIIPVFNSLRTLCKKGWGYLTPQANAPRSLLSPLLLKVTQTGGATTRPFANLPYRLIGDTTDLLPMRQALSLLAPQLTPAGPLATEPAQRLPARW